MDDIFYTKRRTKYGSKSFSGWLTTGQSHVADVAPLTNEKRQVVARVGPDTVQICLPFSTTSSGLFTRWTHTHNHTNALGNVPSGVPS